MEYRNEILIISKTAPKYLEITNNSVSIETLRAYFLSVMSLSYTINSNKYYLEFCGDKLIINPNVGVYNVVNLDGMY